MSLKNFTIVFAQSPAGGESLPAQPKRLVIGIDNPSALVYDDCFTTFYGLRPRVKPPYLFSFFHVTS